MSTSASSFYDYYKTAAPYAAPCIAAGAAIAPPFYLLAAKSDLQRGLPFPRPRISHLSAGLSAMPTVGAIVGLQMATDTALKNGYKKFISKDPHAEVSMKESFAISVLVGFASAPLYAVLNGQTMGQTPKSALVSLDLRQTLSIGTRETFFLASLKATGPLSALLKKQFGDTPEVEHASAFLSGVGGALAGHVGDTALTVFQENKRRASANPSEAPLILWKKGDLLGNLGRLARGSSTRALGVGIFSVLYQITVKTLSPKDEKK